MQSIDPHELRHNGHQAFDFLSAGVRPPVGRLVSIEDVESKLWFEKIPQLILETTRKRNRLSGNQRRASEKIVRLVLCGKPISRRALIETFHVPPEHVTFLVDYATLAIRRCIMELDAELRGCRFLDSAFRARHQLLDLYTPIVLDDDGALPIVASGADHAVRTRNRIEPTGKHGGD